MADETQFDFKVCPGWSSKPLKVTDDMPFHEDEPAPEMFGPGSDIRKSHPNQVLGTVNDTHILALNIFPVFGPQYLLLRQVSPPVTE